MIPYRYGPESAIRAVFFNLWCPLTSALLACCAFPARDFFQKVWNALFSYSFVSALYSRKVRRLHSAPNYPLVVRITPSSGKAFVLWREKIK